MLKKTFIATAALVGFVLASGISAGSAEAQDRRFISIGTGGPTGVYFATGNAICRVVHRQASEGRKHGIRCSAPSTGGSNYNIGQVMAGELDFGIAQSDWQYYAYKGTGGIWEERGAQEKLRAVFSVHGEPFQIIVGADSGITSWAGLKGKRVNIGNPGSGQRGTMELLMAANGMTVSDFAEAKEMTSTEHSKALCDGKIDAFAYTVGVPNAGVALATNGCGARHLSLDGDVEQNLVAENPFYAFSTIPAGTYKTTTSDVTTFGPKATVITSSDVSADTVYEVVRSVFEDLEGFRSLHPAFTTLDPQEMISDALTAPLHDGAIRYYRERGWME